MSPIQCLLKFIVFFWVSSAAAATAESAPLHLTATAYPVAYFAERIGGTAAAVSLPVPAAVDPPFWHPGIQDIATMQRADLILLNGANFERWRAQTTLPHLKLVDTSAGFKDQLIVIESAVTHSHGPAGPHAHSGTAYTTWLDLELASRQADAVASAMIRKRPALGTTFSGNIASLKHDLAVLDGELKALTASKPALPLLGSHPVYQYLARRYGLNLRSVHWEPNEMPADAEWTALAKTLSTHPARWMIWEAQPKAETAARLDKLGVRSLVFDPCGNRPATDDFLSVMRANKENLKQAFQ